MTLRALEVQMMLLQAGVPADALVEPSDAVYKLPTAEWLTGDMHRYFFRALDEFSIREYVGESGDCDDLSRVFIALANIAHRRMPDSAGTALPIGQFSYLRNPEATTKAEQDKHSLVWAVVREGDKPAVIWVEPQILGRVETLAAAQIASATRCSD